MTEKAFSQQEQPDSIVVAIAPEYDQVSKSHRNFFGEGYRKLWAAPVKIRILYLAKERGGLTVVKRGGGLQTRSLRLKDAGGSEWVLRTIQKYPEQGLPPDLKAGLAKDILQDQVVTAHPFASLTVPPMAAALGIPHASPEIVYLPDDTLLGRFRKEFGNAVYLLEEREPVEGGETDNTDKVQLELQEDNDTRVDQRMVLRARLLDLILGDWDRHEDQWRWEKKRSKDNKLYTPVPRDRDMVYYHTTGVFPWVVSHQWLKSKFQGFHSSIRDVKGFNVNARYFDRYFLNGLGEADWEEAIAFVQLHLTDSLVKRSIGLLPDTIFSLSGERLINTILQRRNNIATTARTYYRFLSKEVDIPASDKTESVMIDTDSLGKLAVRINKIKKDGSTGHAIYQRSFDRDVTKEIRIYGFGGNDVFSVRAPKPSGIKIRLIGGNGEDSFHVSAGSSRKQRLFIYDLEGGLDHLETATGARMRLSKDSNINEFDKKAFAYDRFGITTMANYNLDDGTLLTGGFSNLVHGFRKKPYAFYNELLVNYSIGRETFLIKYFASFKELVGKNDLEINLYSKGPLGVSNFFGLGNEAVFENTGNKKIEYYRARYDYVNADVRLYRRVGWHTRVSGGLAAQYYTSSESNNEGNFFDKYNSDYPAALLYTSKIYAGIIASVELDTRNDFSMTSRGLYWNTTIHAMQGTGSGTNHYGNLVTEFSMFNKPFKNFNMVVANRVGGGTTVGEPEFFQQLYLGGKQTLRGFRRNRFAGKTMLYHNFEMRIKLFDFNSYVLPGAIGMIAFNDLGRVWLPGESSSKWHDGYGGGIYIVPARLMVIQGVVAFSKEGVMPYIAIGFHF